MSVLPACTCVYIVCVECLQGSEEDVGFTRASYRCLQATLSVWGTQLRSSARAGCALHQGAISPETGHRYISLTDLNSKQSSCLGFPSTERSQAGTTTSRLRESLMKPACEGRVAGLAKGMGVGVERGTPERTATLYYYLESVTETFLGTGLITVFCTG